MKTSIEIEDQSAGQGVEVKLEIIYLTGPGQLASRDEAFRLLAKAYLEAKERLGVR